MHYEQVEEAFDIVCDRLNSLKITDIPNPAAPFAVVHSEQPIAWFADFKAASSFARKHFEPETYAIGNPSSGPDFLPMFFVQKPLTL
jgi:hypothetical protein